MLFVTTPLYASVVLKISASNPSSFSERVIPVKTYLPKGIMPENVIRSGELDVAFDEERNQSYVYKDLTLEAGESITYDVEIDDIWLIPEESLTRASQQAETLMANMEGTIYHESGVDIKKKIDERIAEIRKNQDDNLVFRVGPTKHIGIHEVNMELLDLVQKDLQELEQIALVAGETDEKARKEALREGKAGAERIYTHQIKNKVLNVSQTGESDGCLVQFALENEEKDFQLNAPETTSFSVVVQNPSRIATKIVPVRYYLAKEIREKDIVDSAGLEVGYDFQRSLYYVYSDGVELKPAEKKVFEIVIANKWDIDKKRLYATKIYIESMLRTSKNAKEVTESVRKLGLSSIEEAYELLEHQDMEQLTESRVELYREDKERIVEVERAIYKIEELLMQAGISPADSLMEQEKYCQEARAKGLSKEEMEKGLEDSTVLQEQKIKELAGTIFAGKSVSATSTWKIITYIIAFLGLISSVFYFVNIRQQQSTMFDPLTGAFSRAYTLERLREEFKVARGAKTKCSLLVMDIDKFKRINDTYGHAVGDTILKEFVIAMRKGVRATDLIGRFGGDEFIIILPTSEKEAAYKIAQGIARVVEGTVITISPQLTLNITTSIGVATFPDDSGTAEDIFDKADKALYEVKKRGGNGAEYFRSEA